MKLPNQPEPSVIHSDTAAALLAYLRDCKMAASHLTPMNLALALEYVYLPKVRFWRDFDISLLTHALDQHVPNWRHDMNQKTANAADDLIKQVEETLKAYQFDEANAEHMLSLPTNERPSDRASAFEWIYTELTRLGQHEDAAYAVRDGHRCGEALLEVLYCVERANEGLPAERLGTSVARFYRDVAMAEADDTVGSTLPEHSAAGI
ncbi:hypothetical protein [Paraburkholderia sp. 22B1P]|uniref:hypothetical protein n=1 Tax=Paraburkholderia sp. 22B1P TaxID=3080498 RepID=UPI00308E09F0|nr:hypothetical protein PBP221_33760 [Paraburkholderia sp. 22B1P]